MNLYVLLQLLSVKNILKSIFASLWHVHEITFMVFSFHEIVLATGWQYNSTIYTEYFKTVVRLRFYTLSQLYKQLTLITHRLAVCFIIICIQGCLNRQGPLGLKLFSEPSQLTCIKLFIFSHVLSRRKILELCNKISSYFVLIRNIISEYINFN